MNMTESKRNNNIEQANKNEKLRVFEVSNKVLYRVPGLSSKLEDF